MRATTATVLGVTVALFASCCTAQFDFFGGGNESGAGGTIGEWLLAYNGSVSAIAGGLTYSGFESLPASIRVALPIPNLDLSSPDSIDFAALQPYAINVGAWAGAGFVLAILSLLVALVYIPIRLCCACCAKKKRHKRLEVKASANTILLFIILVTAAVSSVVALAAGVVANFGFTGSLAGLSGNVNGAATTVSGLITSISDFIDTIPSLVTAFMQDLAATLGAINGVLDNARDLVVSLRSLSNAIVELDNELQAIPPAFQPAELSAEVSALSSTMNATCNEAEAVVDNIGSGTIAEITNGSFFSSFNVSEMTGDISAMFDELTGTIDTYAGLGRNYSAMVLGYDRYRLAAINVIYAMPILCILLVGLAAFTKQGWLFHITVTLGLIFLFLAFLLGSVQFVLAIVLGDACTALRSFPLPGNIYSILSSCSANSSLLDVLGFGDLLASPDFLDVSQFTNLSGLVTSGYDAASIDSFVNRSSSLSAFSNITNITGYIDNVVNASVEASVSFHVLEGSIDNVSTTLGPAISDKVETFMSSAGDAVRDLARCGFVADTFASVHNNICIDLLASLDVGWITMYVVALATIPMIVVESKLIARYKTHREERKRKASEEEGEGEGDEEEEEEEVDLPVSHRNNAVYPAESDVATERA